MTIINTRPKTTTTNQDAFKWNEQDVKTAILKQITDFYLNLKEALAEDDEAQALKIASDIKDYLASERFLNKSAKEEFQEIITKMASSKSIEIARIHFQDLSNALIVLMEKENPLEETLYVQFCPMADNDRGAFWLSTEEEIKNPYFGSMMLKCGNVDREIK